MRALVTGGNGHLGQALVALLLARGHTVRATVRSLADAAKTAPLRALGPVELFEADVRDRAALEAALAGVDVLFHAAAVYAITRGADTGELIGSAVAGTEAALLAVERGATGRFIVADDEIPSFDAIVRAIGRIDARVKPPLFVLPRIAAPMLPWADAFFHAVIGTPRIATPELIASSVGDRLFHFSAERAKRELGWAPRIPFEQSLRETLVHARGLAAR